MLRPVIFAACTTFSIAALGQAVPEWKRAENAKAAAESAKPKSVCELMSPEEMHECLVTKPHKPGRSVYCDKVSRSEIESCLGQSNSGSSGATGQSKESADAK